MKRFVISLILLFVGAVTFIGLAKDVVYLKNGSVIKGTVLEIKPEQSIKIKTSDGSIFVFQIDEVDHMQTEPDNDNQVYKAEEASNSYLDRGFRGLVDFGGHVGFSDGKDNYQFSAAFTGGYQFNSFLFVGGGVSPTVNLYYNDWYYDDEIETSVFIPIYGAIRFDFIDKKVTPFLDARVGYYINTKDTDNGGLYVYGGVGARIKRFSISAGCDLYKNDYINGLFATMRFGFEF